MALYYDLPVFKDLYTLILLILFRMLLIFHHRSGPDFMFQNQL